MVIYGVEKQSQNENVADIAKKIIEYLDIKTEKTHIIKNAYRKTINQSGPIIVETTNKKIKEEILQTKKECDSIHVKDCGLKGSNNEQLTTITNTLYYKIRNKKRKKIKYLWTRDGTIFVKKTADGEKIKIRNEEDIKRLG